MTTGTDANQRSHIDPSEPVEVNVDDLEKRAKESRERLLKAVEALDKKRHNLTHPLKAIPAGVVPALAAALAVAAVAAVAGVVITKQRKRRSGFSRIFQRRQGPSFVSQLVRHAGLSILTFALAEAGKVTVKRLMRSGAEIELSRRPGPTR